MRVAGRLAARAVFDEHAWRSLDGKGPLKAEGTLRTVMLRISDPPP
jgi:hypothetical protein